MCKIQQAMKNDALRTTRIHPAVHPGNRDEVFIWQNFQPAYRDLGWKTEISETGLIWKGPYSRLNQVWRTSKNGWAYPNSKYQPFRIDSDATLPINSIWVMWTTASEPGLSLNSWDALFPKIMPMALVTWWEKVGIALGKREKTLINYDNLFCWASRFYFCNHVKSVESNCHFGENFTCSTSFLAEVRSL